MSDNKGFNLTEEQLTGMVAKAVEAAVRASKALNPLEQKAYDDQIAAEQRKKQMIVELGRAEEQAMWNKKHGCSHSRHSMAAGKIGGHSCKKGTGEWCTSGQFCGEEPGTGMPYALLVCTRCSWTWKWKPTPHERHQLEDNGFLGYPPPAEDRLIDAEGRPLAVSA
jgi:hypothetical protein